MGTKQCKDCIFWGKEIPDLTGETKMLKYIEEGNRPFCYSAKETQEHLVKAKKNIRYYKKYNKFMKVCSNKKIVSFCYSPDYPEYKSDFAIYGEYANSDAGYGRGDYFITGQNFGCIHFKEKDNEMQKV